MSTSPKSPAEAGVDHPQGFAYALGAYLIWGMLPLYVAQLSHIPPLEVLAHRVIWSVPVAMLLLWWTGRTSDLRAAFANPRMLMMAALTAAIVSVNWGIYIWAIHTGQTMQAALGYYINPLFSVLLGWLLLGERLTPMKWLALASAFGAVLVLTFEGGQVPWAALGVMVSWGLYAYFKRSLPIGPNQGFALEVILLSPLALAYLVWAETQGLASFPHSGWGDFGLLFGMGLATAIPLILYANGAKLLRLSTIAIMQYISPTAIFLTAVFIFGEPFGRAQAIAFPMIWLALVIYVAALIREGRARRAG